MLKAWNQQLNRWEIVDEALAQRLRARGGKVIERPDAPAPAPSFEDDGPPVVFDSAGGAVTLPPVPDQGDAERTQDAAGVAAAFDTSDTSAEQPAALPPPPASEDLEASRKATTAPLLVITDAELATPIGGTVGSAIVLEFKQSSNIQRASLDPGTGIVTVSFANGTTYRYANFTPAMMTAWREAKSAGSWFYANVKSQAKKHPIVGLAGEG